MGECRVEYRNLGRSGLKVSKLCLGAMMFGGPTAPEDAEAMVEDARAAGVNFIDTADGYNRGRSEEVVGRAVARDRDGWVIATKLFNPMEEGPNGGGLSRKWMLRACEASLKRLGTDRIDLYYLHKEDPDTPLEETVRAMDDLIRAGKVLYYGVSNYRSWRVAEICRIADALGAPRPVASQPYYNAVNRMPEAEHLPACNWFGLGVVPYSPVARGVLTGKYRPGSKPEAGSRAARGDRRIRETELRDESLEIAAKVVAHAGRRGMSAAQFATLWVLNNRFVTSVIAGPRTGEQWRDYLGAMDHAFTGEDEALIDALVAPGHPSTPGYNDPQYPVEGRPVRTARQGQEVPQ